MNKKQTGSAPTAALVFMLLPVGILGVVSTASAVHARWAAAAATGHVPGGTAATWPVNESAARAQAARLTGAIVDQSVDILEARPIVCGSARNDRPIRIWDVTCAAGDDLYEVRVDASSGAVFGLNLLSSSRPADAASESASPLPLSARDAEIEARDCLSAMGADLRGLKPMYATKSCDADNRPTAWNFAYRGRVIGRTRSGGSSGRGDHLMTVSIDGRTGALENAWVPALCL